MPVHRVCLLVGPSGVGKTTIQRRLIEDDPDTFGLMVSHTTRLPRPGEEDGIDYYFVPRHLFADMEENGEFLETASFKGERYGSSQLAMEVASGRESVCIHVCEAKGVESFRNLACESSQPPELGCHITCKVLVVEVSVSSDEELLRRLRVRHGKDYLPADGILRDVKSLGSRDDEPNVKYRTVLNDDLESAIGEIKMLLRTEF